MGKGSHIHDWVVLQNAGNPNSDPAQDGIIVSCPGCEETGWLPPSEALKFLDAKEKGLPVEVDLVPLQN